MTITITDGTDVVTVLRTNHARNAMPVGPVSGGAVPGFAVYTAGTGEAGATTVVAPGGDGPVVDGQVLGYARRTVTTPKTGASTGWAATNSAYRLPLSGDASSRLTVSLLSRFTAASDPGAIHRAVRLRGQGYTSGGVAVNQTDTAVVNLPMNEWALIPVTYVPTGEFVTFGWWLYQSTGSNLPAASTLDVAGLMIEDGETATTWFYGASPADPPLSYAYLGAANASASVEVQTLPRTSTPDHLVSAAQQHDPGNIAHVTLDREDPDVTLRPTRLRSGTLQLAYGSLDAALDGLAMHRARGAVLTLADDYAPALGMTYVPVDRISVDRDTSRPRTWVLSVDYVEVAP